MTIWTPDQWSPGQFRTIGWNQSTNSPQVATEQVTFTVAPASFDTRRRAFIEGHGGSTLNGAYWILPGLDVEPDRYVWWSHGGYNLDPGDHVPELVGFTGVEVPLQAGNRTAAQRASATKAVLNQIPNWRASGLGATIRLTAPIDSGSVEIGGPYTARGTAGLFGTHTTAVLSNGNPFNAVIAAHTTFTAGPAILTGIGVLLGSADPLDQVRVAIYSGGSSTWGTSPTLVAQGIVTGTDDGSGNVYAFLPLTAAQSAALADNASLWILAKANQTHGTHPAFASLANREDLTNRNLVIINTGISNDPTVAFPSSLAGITDVDESNAVVMMCCFEYRTTPLAGDGSLGGTTTNGLILGMHTNNVLAASESSLTAPDPGGANVTVGLVTPPILGMLETRRETALHDISGGLMRTAEYTGAAVGDPDGAVLLQDHGAVTAGASMAWVGQNASPEVPIAASSILHMAIRGNGGIAVGFVAGASPETANPPNDPSDFATSPTDEYETNTDNPAHSTNDAVGFETPFSTDPDDLQPGNFPGMRIRFRVPGDSVA